MKKIKEKASKQSNSERISIPKKKRLCIVLLIAAVVIALTGACLILRFFQPSNDTSTGSTQSGMADVIDDSENHGYCLDGSVHTFQSTTTQANCTQRGYVTNICEKCGYTYLSYMENALGHQWAEPICIKPLSCTEDGQQSKTCERCGLTTESALYHSGHRYALSSLNDELDIEKAIYVCTICQDRIALQQDELPQQQVREYVFLPDRDPEFSFIVSFTGDEAYLRSQLTLTGENGNIEYTVTPVNEGYRISPVIPYQQYQSYSASVSGEMMFAEYNTKKLTFSIIGSERATVVFNNDDLIFLKTLELQQYGSYGLYEVDWDEAAQRYFLTFVKSSVVTDSMIGKIIVIGDYTDTQEILADSSRDLLFAKLERIIHNAEGKTMLELSVPQVSEVFDEIDLYFTGDAPGDSFAANEAIEQDFMNALVASDGFTEYTTAMHLAAVSYAGEHGLVVEPLSAISENNIKFDLTKHSLEKLPKKYACQLELEGTITYKISLKDKSGKERGSVTLTCKAGISSTILAGGHYRNMESVNLYLCNDTTTTLNFNLRFNLKYNYEYETKFLLNTNTKKIHTSTCRIATKETNKANIKSFTLQELSEQYHGDKELMKAHECKVCLAVTGMDATAYVLNNNTGVLHCMNCRHVDSIKDCNLFTLHPADTSAFVNCQDCQPQNRQTQDFDARMLNAIRGSDWEKQIKSVKEELKDAIGKKDAKPVTDPKLSVPINVAGVLNIEIGISPVFEFDMEATANLTISASTWNIYGIRSVGENFETYNLEISKPIDYTLDFLGEADIKFGVAMTIKAYPVGLEAAAHIGISGQVGLYGHLSGIFHVSGSLGGETDSFCAARLEAGLYVKIDGYWKILCFDNAFTIVSEKRLPMCKWGYDRVYYSFSEENTVLNLEEWDDKTFMNIEYLLKANFLDLSTMEKKTGYVSIKGKSSIDITIDVRNEDGTPCDYLVYRRENGYLIKKAGAPESFTVLIYITIDPITTISNLEDFFNSQSCYAVYGYFLDTRVVRINVGINGSDDVDDPDDTDGSDDVDDPDDTDDSDDVDDPSDTDGSDDVDDPNDTDDEGPTNDMVTVRVQVPKYWTDVWAYAWNEDATGYVYDEPLGVWPGSQMNLVGIWFEVQIPKDMTRIIINDCNDASADGLQTADLAIVPGKDVWIVIHDDMHISVSYGPDSSGTGYTCGSKLNWMVDGSTLNIVGTGEMNGYPYTPAPWYDYSGSISEIVVGNGVTFVGRYAFSHCVNADSIRFVGDAPDFKEDAFSGIKITAYYPLGNPTWTNEVMQDYGGRITWIPEV